MHIELADTYLDPNLGREAATPLGPCVQFECTVTCFIFRRHNAEGVGPRGRIYLIKQAVRSHTEWLNTTLTAGGILDAH